MTWQQERKLMAKQFKHLCSMLILSKNDDGTPKYPGVYNDWVEKWMEEME